MSRSRPCCTSKLILSSRGIKYFPLPWEGLTAHNETWRDLLLVDDLCGSPAFQDAAQESVQPMARYEGPKQWQTRT